MTKQRDVFISYHTTTAKELVVNLGDKLESRNITCWYAPRDCDNNYDEAIMQALNVAHIFLLIINKGSMQSMEVQNEIAEAFRRIAQKHMYPVLFQIDSFPVSDSLRYYLGRVHRVNGTEPPLEDRIEELVSRVSYVKENLSLKESFFEDYETRLLSSTITPASYFVGRKKEQQEIYDFLQQYKKIFVSGMGGIGKSQLVRQFAITYKDCFRTVIWTTYDTDLKDLIASDDNIKISNFPKATPNESSEQYFNRKFDYLANCSTDEDLLIIDNFDVTKDKYLDKIMSLPLNIIFTTRIEQGNNYSVKKIDNDEELLELFAKGYSRALDEEGKSVVRKIIKTLDGHTLAIRIVSNLMRDKRIRPAEMLAKLQSNSADEAGNNPLQDIYAQLASMFDLSNLAEEEISVLYSLSLLPTSGMDAMDFHDLCKLEDYITIDSLSARNWILHDIASDYISMHPVLKTLCLKEIAFSDELIKNFLTSATDIVKHFQFDNFAKTSFWLYVSQAILKVMPNSSVFFQDFALAATKLLHHVSMHDAIIDNMKRLSTLELTDELRLNICLKIADAYRCKEMKDEMLECLQEAETLLAKCRLDEMRYADYFATILSIYGWYYRLSKEPQKALDANLQSLQLRKKFHGDNILNVGWGYFNVGVALATLGENTQSLDYFRQAVSCFEQIDSLFGKACCYKSMSSTFLSDKNYVEMLNHIQRALELFVQTVGEFQTDTAQCYRLLAIAHNKLGNKDMAIKEYKKAYDICQSLKMYTVWEHWETQDRKEDNYLL